MPILASNNDIEYANFEGFDNYNHFETSDDGAVAVDPVDVDPDAVDPDAVDTDAVDPVAVDTDAVVTNPDFDISDQQSGDEPIYYNQQEEEETIMESFDDGASQQPVNNLLSLDLLLKSILFGLLFYLVAHPDVCNMMKKMFGKLSGEPLRLACMALFVVCYYVINLLI